MVNSLKKKALLVQGLFFCLSLFGQDIAIQSPGPNAVLQDTQEFVITTLGTTPERIDFYLNGRLLLARKEPPFTFQIRWNTRYKNTVRITAYYPDRDPVTITREYQEIQVDVEESVEAFQFFPFVERPDKLGDWKVTSNGQPVTPQAFEPADRFPLELVIALDTSGSMMFNFDELEQPLRGLIAWCKERNYPLYFLIFDSRPSLIRLENLPPSLKALYRERPSSVVWDTIATASGLYKESPRRVMLLISDGSDQGSKHSAETAAVYLRKSNASLIWVSPANVPNRDLFRLAKKSGGFTTFMRGGDPWPGLLFLLDKQHHLMAPDASWPINVKVGKGRVWYPRWEK